MRAVVVVVSDVLNEHLLEMAPPEDEEPIGALSTDGAPESLGECVRSWRSNGCLDDLDCQHRSKTDPLPPGRIR